MSRVFIYITTFSILALFFLGLFGFQTLSYAQVDKGAMEDNLKDIQSEKSKLEKEIKKKEKAKKEAGYDLWKADDDLEYTQKKLVRQVNDLDRIQKQSIIYSNQLAIAEKDLNTSQTIFEERIRVFYKNGARSLLSVIVDARDLSDLVFRIRCTEKLLTDHEATIDNIVLQKNELSRLKDESLAKVEEEDRIRGEIAIDRNRIAKLRNEKKSIFNDYSSDVKKLKKLLAETEKEEIQIQFFLENIAKGNSSTNFDGEFSIPLTNYRLSSGYGMRTHPIFRRRKHHNGLDMSAPYGTRILAAGAGKVVFAGKKGGYGNMVMIDHGRGYATLYAHMSTILTSTGLEVGEGQPIGKVGSTGLSTGNHLHFEVRINGKHQNPKKFLSF